MPPWATPAASDWLRCRRWALPGMTKDVPKMLMDPLHPLVIRLGYLHKSLPWLLKFRRSLKKERVESIADARAALLGQAYDAYDTMLGESGLEDMVFSRGLIFAHESENGLAKSQYALDMRRKRGVRMEEMSGDQLREVEPALSDDVKCGVFFPDVRTTVNPQRLTKEVAKDFTKRGGKILRETVRGLEVGPDGPTKVHTDAGSHDCDVVVLSAGAWSKPLAAQLGTKVYLEAERGYHIMIADPGVDVKIPLAASDRNVSINHMEHGLRMSTMAEFSGIDAPPDHDRALRVFESARGVLKDLNFEVTSQWVGSRPSTPDALPGHRPIAQLPERSVRLRPRAPGRYLRSGDWKNRQSAGDGHPAQLGYQRLSSGPGLRWRSSAAVAPRLRSRSCPIGCGGRSGSPISSSIA